MLFSTAFERIKKGAGMRLPQWPEGELVRAQLPDEKYGIIEPYLYLQRNDGSVIVWKESYIELFSEEWQTVE